MLQLLEESTITWNEPINSFVINGDPGCDGYNTEAVVILEETLKIPTDFTIINGDLVPIGRGTYFKQFADIVDSNSSTPVFCVPGNHDLPDYEYFCGKKDYIIKAPNALLIVLDNSRRYFTAETLRFLAEALNENAHENTFIFFHIPLPNNIVPNHVSQDEWEKLKEIMEPCKANIQAIFCGHVHSAFEFNLDGYRVIVSGGGGAFLDPVDNTFFKRNKHHVLKVEFNENSWSPRVLPIEHQKINNEPLEGEEYEQINIDLEEGFSGEAQAYRKYLIFSELAEAEGFPGIAKLFRAASESEFHHSKNMFLASGQPKSTMRNLERSIARENEEVQDIYPGFIQNAEKIPSKRALNAYKCALAAEKVHYQLFSEALESLENGTDIPITKIFTCKRCGYTHAGNQAPNLCPACGADRFKFKEVD